MFTKSTQKQNNIFSHSLGLIISFLCELTLPQEANIYAQQYALCLPDKKLLKEKLKEWIDEFNEQNYSCSPQGAFY